MPRSPSPTLTDAELAVMHLLWARSPATIREMVDAQARRPPLSYNSIATVLRILADKGHVRAERDGRTLVYHSLLEPEEAADDAVEFVVSRFFADSRTLLALNILEEKGLEAEELERLERLVAESAGEER